MLIVDSKAGSAKTPNLARVYTALGKAYGTLTEDRLNILHKAFTYS